MITYLIEQTTGEYLVVTETPALVVDKACDILEAEVAQAQAKKRGAEVIWIASYEYDYYPITEKVNGHIV